MAETKKIIDLDYVNGWNKEFPTPEQHKIMDDCSDAVNAYWKEHKCAPPKEVHDIVYSKPYSCVSRTVCHTCGYAYSVDSGG